MKVFWLNDALSIQAENAEERHSLALLLKGLGDPETYKDADEETGVEETQGDSKAVRSH